MAKQAVCSLAQWLKDPRTHHWYVTNSIASMLLFPSCDLTSSQVVQLADFAAASATQVAAVHSGRYVEELDRVCREVTEKAVLVDSAPTYATGTTYNDAMRAAGAAIGLVDAVVAASLARGPSGKDLNKAHEWWSAFPLF